PSGHLPLKRGGGILNGPGKLTKHLRITKSLNGLDLTKKTKLWVESAPRPLKFKRKIVKSPRIGVSYARHCQKWKWNFKLTKLNS
ncbi:MAG TPA: DNA-3-methyladenine glycosylase, partial [Candidatus Moranbacteria bacterium]|nr:DNA-3-methyladenine glycosylase [Candidatus Moranbacteria bacterium]